MPSFPSGDPEIRATPNIFKNSPHSCLLRIAPRKRGSMHSFCCLHYVIAGDSHITLTDGFLAGDYRLPGLQGLTSTSTSTSTSLLLAHLITNFLQSAPHPLLMYPKSTPLSLLPSPPPSSPVTGNQSPPQNFLYTITSFIRSEHYRDGSADLVISPIDIQLFHREIQQPVILSDSEAKSLRYVNDTPMV